GGGSIAWVDNGTLRVGPQSAGAAPGPACYGLGGVEPTVTDANLVLGYLSAAEFAFPLSVELAEQALARVAEPLGVDAVTAAAAIHEIANAQMGAAIHVVTVRRGIDPRGYTLVALGGAAPTHVAGLAALFGITRVLMPPNCGVGSAAGLLYASLAVERARTFLSPVGTLTSCSAGGDALSELSDLLAELEENARADLSHPEGTEVVRSVGVRFLGQAHAFTIELASGPVTPALIGQVVEEFYQRYHESYGIALRDPAELTTARVRVVLPASTPRMVPDQVRQADQVRTRRVWVDGGFADIPVVTRVPGRELQGPGILTEPQCSLLVPPGWQATVDADGAVVLEVSA
ncbi:MAG: hydantoinase/oxoprolinase family protein, partial [Streptosporangiaceae bacterium]